MTVTWLIVLLFIAFVSARLFQSTKMWWIFVSAIMAGLLVGMLSKEAKSHLSKSDAASITQLINTVDNGCSACMQRVETVTEGPTGRSGVVSYIAEYSDPLSDALVSRHISKGRDSPGIEDDS